MDLKEEEALGRDAATHWYYRAKAIAMERFLPQREVGLILDVGAGSGFFTKHLLRWNNANEGLCVDVNYTRDHDDSIGGKAIRYRRETGPVAADLVLMMDVLEHVDDDLGLLSEYVQLVPSGAHFLITVPAFQILWSGHDVFLGHRRRYTLRQLEDRARHAGLSILRSSYFFGAVFPLAAATRLLERVSFRKQQARSSQLRRHSPAINALLFGLCRLDFVFFRANRIAGLTAICVAQKP